jgi:hypothetical protein
MSPDTDTDLQALVTILRNAIEMHEPGKDPGVIISELAAMGILAILEDQPHSSPKGRPSEWSYFDEQHAWRELLRDANVSVLARQMVRLTGQKKISALRRLREMKASEHFRKLQAKAKRGVQK